MIEFGKSLRAAREAKGLSVRQLAEMTRMAPTSVLELESENFSRIAAPIYGRGFVKLYCEAVGLDPRPHIDEFMELYNGNRQTEIRERPVREQHGDPAGNPTDITDAEPPRQEQEQILAASTVHASEPTPDLFGNPADELSDDNPALPQEPALSRYATPMRQATSSFDPHALLRLTLLAAVAVSLLALLFFGLRAVYRATTRPSDPEPAEDALFAKDEPAPARQKDPASSSTKTPRTPLKIPSLYID